MRRLIVCCLLGVAVAAQGAESPAAAEKLYQNRWAWATHKSKFDKKPDWVFFSELAPRMKAGGYNGLLYGKGVDACWRWKKPQRENFLKMVDTLKENGIEFIPAVWCIGYGAMGEVDPTVFECEPAKDVPYDVVDGVARPHCEALVVENPGFEEYDLQANVPRGWRVDGAGTRVFVDTEVVHGGRASMRIEAKEGGKKAADVGRTFAVKPHHYYRFSAWLKQDHVVPNGSMRLIAGSPGSWTIDASRQCHLPPDDDGWHEYAVEFFSSTATEVNIYAISIQNKSGRFWVDDVRFEDRGVKDVVVREDIPFVVRDAESGTVFEEGRDYRNPKAGSVSFELVKGGRIDGKTRLVVDAYVPASHGKSGQKSSCPSDPRLYALFEKSADAIVELLHPKKWCLSVDEIRSGNTCPRCTARNTDMAHLIGDAVTRMCEIIRKRCPDAEIYTWSDMFDPGHNARESYYNNRFTGIWDLIPKDIVMICWSRAKFPASCPFFTERDFRVMTAGFYDRSDSDVWGDSIYLDWMNKTPGALGWCYATWVGDYHLLERYGEFMNAGSRPMDATIAAPTANPILKSPGAKAASPAANGAGTRLNWNDEGDPQ